MTETRPLNEILIPDEITQGSTANSSTDPSYLFSQLDRRTRWTSIALFVALVVCALAAAFVTAVFAAVVAAVLFLAGVFVRLAGLVMGRKAHSKA